MIRTVEYYHGVVFARLCRQIVDEGVAIRAFGIGRSAYVLDERVGLYVKYSEKRMSPWSFSFSRGHQEEIAELKAHQLEVFVAFVCGGDGVACLSSSELSRVLDDEFEDIEWVKVARRAREKYSITGSDGRKVFKVGDNEYPAKVLDSLGKVSSGEAEVPA